MFSINSAPASRLTTSGPEAKKTLSFFSNSLIYFPSCVCNRVCHVLRLRVFLISLGTKVSSSWWLLQFAHHLAVTYRITMIFTKKQTGKSVSTREMFRFKKRKWNQSPRKWLPPGYRLSLSPASALTRTTACDWHETGPKVQKQNGKKIIKSNLLSAIEQQRENGINRQQKHKRKIIKCLSLSLFSTISFDGEIRRKLQALSPEGCSINSLLSGYCSSGR